VILTRDGRPVAMVHAIDPDQAWFWTPEWRVKEREVDEEVTAGTVSRPEYSNPVRIFWSIWKLSSKIYRSCESNARAGAGVRPRFRETYLDQQQRRFLAAVAAMVADLKLAGNSGRVYA